MAEALAPSSPNSFASFGALLRYLRVRARLSQRELAVAAGYSEGQISRLEQGQRRPDPDVVRTRFVPALELAPTDPWAARLVTLASDEETPGQPAASPTVVPTTAAPQARLLATKLFPPPPRPGAVERPRLTGRLAGIWRARLTVVAAPAGFGKSTLLAAWLAELERTPQSGELPDSAGDSPALRSAWLSLDPGDGDLATFLRYLVAALRGVEAGIGASTLALLDQPQLPGLAALLTPLLNDLAALPVRCALILDDYHAIAAAPVHEATALLVERLPMNIHLVVLTRDDPPLPLARLRARGELLELRAADLRFVGAETAAFLGGTMGLGLDPAATAALEARTEGWPAGLQLAALALRERADQAGFVAALAGSGRYILDYLAEEVLDRFPEHLRSFLLQTSILERLSGDLCDAVLGLVPEPAGPVHADSFSRLLLADLERRNLFLIPLDNERGWYRWHQLFAELLRERLRVGSLPGRVAELHSRASAWFALRGFVPEAVRHALAAGDWPRASALIEGVAQQLIDRGEQATARAWLDALPVELLRERPRLALARAEILFFAHAVDAAAACLEDVARAAAAEPDPAERAALLGEAAVTGAGIAVIRNDFASAIAQGERGLATLPEDRPRLRGRALLYMAIAHGYSGDVMVGAQNCAEANRAALAADDLAGAIHSFSTWGVLELQQGRLAEAEQRFRSGLRLAAERGVTTLPVVALLRANYAELLGERFELEAGEQQAAAAIDHSERFELPRYLVLAHQNMARLRLSRGDLEGARYHLEAAEAAVTHHGLPKSHAAAVAFSRTLLLLVEGAPAQALAAAEALGVRSDSILGPQHELEQITLARLLVAAGELGRALPLIAGLAAAPHGRALRRVMVLATHAHALHRAGDTLAALAALREALELGRPGGVVRSFVDEGPPVAELLTILRAELPAGALAAYVERVLGCFPARARA